MLVSVKCSNVEYSITQTKVLSDEAIKVYKKISANGTRRRLTMQWYVLQYVQVTLG